ncbi:MAG: hypothetical protein P9L94_00560 [Candidatus Hinthialibacter antarcticus]|nr:hypothetical protein [Candidatus Hinthialibacter antarcticus]
MRKFVLWSICFVFSGAVWAQPLGIFSDRADIGEPNLEGLSSISGDIYTIEAGGATIGRRSYVDQLHFVYKEVSGSFDIITDPIPVEAAGEGGIMVRQDLDPDSAHVSWLRTSDTVAGGNTNAAGGSIFPHIRSLKGGGTIVDGDREPGGYSDVNIGAIRVQRIGNHFRLYTTDNAGEWSLAQDEIIPMAETVLVGLAVTANNADGLGVFEFEGTEINEYPLWVGRSVSVDDWQGGATIQVTLTAKARSAVSGNVSEVVPRLATVSNVQASAGQTSVDARNGKIAWLLDNLSGDATLTYDLTLPDRKSGSWTGQFTDGTNPQSHVGGDAVLPKNPTFKTNPAAVQISPDKPTIIQIEDFMVGADVDPPGFGLYLDPESESGITAVAVSGSVNDWVQIPVIIPANYGTAYMFGQVRGEDGNSDSFFIDLGFELINDNLTTWDSGGGKALHLDWVNNRIPEDPRPFDVDAGEQMLYVGPREDSAVFDWIAITNDPTFQSAALDELTGEIIDPFVGLTDDLGIFDANMDIAEDGGANLGFDGDAGYIASEEVYKVVGSGNDIWGTADNFHFIYKEVSGDVTIETNVYLDEFSGNGTWAKAGPMLRDELTPSSAHTFSMIRTQGRDFDPQWRMADAASGESLSALFSGASTERVGLQRTGNTVTYYYIDKFTGERTDLHVIEDLAFTDPIYAGLAVTAHDIGTLSIGEFSDVVLTTGGGPVKVDNWSLY